MAVHLSRVVREEVYATPVSLKVLYPRRMPARTGTNLLRTMPRRIIRANLARLIFTTTMTPETKLLLNKDDT